MVLVVRLAGQVAELLELARVDFGDTDVSKCAFQVSSANPAETRIGSADVFASDKTQAQVRLHDQTTTAADGDFSLTVVC